MTLRELIDHVTTRGFFNKVGSHLQMMNSDWKDHDITEITKSYRKVVDEIADLPGGDDLTGHVIVVDQVSADEISYIDVYMKDEQGQRWRIDFLDWNELVDLKIDDRISNEVSEMLAHILYEVTWWGRTRRSVTDQGKELLAEAQDKDNLLMFSLSSLNS